MALAFLPIGLVVLAVQIGPVGLFVRRSGVGQWVGRPIRLPVLAVRPVVLLVLVLVLLVPVPSVSPFVLRVGVLELVRLLVRVRPILA
jgi:hypothetical protein